MPKLFKLAYTLFFIVTVNAHADDLSIHGGFVKAGGIPWFRIWGKAGFGGDDWQVNKHYSLGLYYTAKTVCGRGGCLDINFGGNYVKNNSNYFIFRAVPMYAYYFGDIASIKIGVGPSYLTTNQISANRTQATRWNFADILQLNFYIKKKYIIGGELAHYSNADTYKPNPGLNIYTIKFGVDPDYF